MADQHTSTYLGRVETGIARTRYGYRAIVNAAAGRKERRFPRDTDLAIVRRWRAETRARFAHAEMRRRSVTTIPVLPRSLEGWCFLYVVAGDDVVKIGRTVNPHVRLYELQTGHDADLELLVVTPIHGSLEAAIHLRFEHLRKNGEWFYLNDEMAEFIADLQNGGNPVSWVWDLARVDGELNRKDVLLRWRRHGSKQMKRSPRRAEVAAQLPVGPPPST